MEPSPGPSQQEVYALFGQCLLRFQQYESLMKQMLGMRSMSTGFAGAPPSERSPDDSHGGATLGAAVKRFFRELVVVEGSPASVESRSNPDLTAISVTTSVRVEIDAAEHEVARRAAEDLVERRNTLVHHFVELFDLWSDTGRTKAIAYLDAASARIKTELEQLQHLARAMTDARRTACESLRSGVVEDFVVDGIAPDGCVDWGRAGIAQCLREAAREVQVDGWAPLSSAIAWMGSRYPDQTPARYGCRSWPQVVNDSKLFDLKYTTDAEAARAAQYRERLAGDKATRAG